MKDSLLSIPYHSLFPILLSFTTVSFLLQEDLGLDDEQINVLKRCFDGFADEDGVIPAENVGNILSMMGLKVKPTALRGIIEEIDEDGSGLLEFGEFCQLAAKFLVEEDEEALKKELKEAFRIYDKEGMTSIRHYLQQ